MQLEYMRSRDYVIELLTKYHNATSTDANRRANTITAHTRAAHSLLSQCFGTENETAFLAGSYFFYR